MIGILILTLVALIFGIILVNLESKLVNKADEIKELLPNYNCGACGYKGCEDLALAISKDPTLYTKCRVLRGDNLIKMQEYLKENLNKNIIKSKIYLNHF